VCYGDVRLVVGSEPSVPGALSTRARDKQKAGTNRQFLPSAEAPQFPALNGSDAGRDERGKGVVCSHICGIAVAGRGKPQEPSSEMRDRP